LITILLDLSIPGFDTAIHSYYAAVRQAALPVMWPWPRHQTSRPRPRPRHFLQLTQISPVTRVACLNCM